MNARRAAGLIALGALAGCAPRDVRPAVGADLSFRVQGTVLTEQALTPDGRVLWTRTADGIPSRSGVRAGSLALDPDGGLWQADEFNPDRHDAPGPRQLRRFDPALGLAWSVTFPGDLSLQESFSAMAFDPRGDVWIASRAVVPTELDPESAWLFRRFRPDGAVAFSRSACFGTCHGEPVAMACPAPDALVVAAIDQKLSVTTRFGPTGDPDWSWVDDLVHLTGLAPAPAGGTYACGNRPTEAGEVWEVVRLDAKGTVAWTRSFTQDRFTVHPARALACAALPGGGLVVAGTETALSVPPNDDWHVRAYGPDGAPRWDAAFGSAPDGVTLLNDAPTAVDVDAAGNVYVLGVLGAGSTARTAVLRKYGPAGDLAWSQTVAGAKALRVARDGTVRVAGSLTTVFYRGLAVRL